MGYRQKSWATRKRLELVKLLGGECRQCGSKGDLQIDHINGKSWTANKVGSDTRVCRYMREMKEGKLQVLCGDCNSKKGGDGQYYGPRQRKRTRK